MCYRLNGVGKRVHDNKRASFVAAPQARERDSSMPVTHASRSPSADLFTVPLDQSDPDVADADGRLTYEISGDGFLRYMVRAIVGTLVEIGRGFRAPESIAPLLRGSARGDAGPTAPPHGLFLVRVDYH